METKVRNSKPIPALALMLASLLAACEAPVKMPEVDVPVPVPDPTTPVPCGTFKSIPLTCTSDLGKFEYKFDLEVVCDMLGGPVRVRTAQSTDSPKDFSLGAKCSIKTDAWVIDDTFEGATIDCTDDWSDGSSTHYVFEMKFASNTDPVHGTIYFESTYKDKTTTYTPGYSDCVF